MKKALATIGLALASAVTSNAGPWIEDWTIRAAFDEQESKIEEQESKIRRQQADIEDLQRKIDDLEYQVDNLEDR